MNSVIYCKCGIFRLTTPSLVVAQDEREFSVYLSSVDRDVTIIEATDGIWPAGRYRFSFRYRYGGLHRFLGDEFTSAGKVLEYVYSRARPGRISGGRLVIDVEVKYPFIPPPSSTANTVSEFVGQGSDGKTIAEHKILFADFYYAVIASHRGIDKYMIENEITPIVSDGAVRINIPDPLPDRRVEWSQSFVEIPETSIEVPGAGDLYTRLKAFRKETLQKMKEEVQNVPSRTQ